jgi:hypothetical protein
MREEIVRGERWGKSREGNAGRLASGMEAPEKNKRFAEGNRGRKSREESAGENRKKEVLEKIA